MKEQPSKVVVDLSTGIVEDIKINSEATPIPTVTEVDKEQRTIKTEELAQEVTSRQIEVELTKGYREIDVLTYGKLKIVRPTIDDDYEADLIYAKELNKLMASSELPTIEEMEERLRKRGAGDIVDKDKTDQLRQELIDISTELGLAKAEFTAKKSQKLRNQINSLTKKYNEAKTVFLKREALRSKYMALTLEGRADEQRLVVKMSRCVLKENGERLWNSPEDLKKERDASPVSRIVYEFITFSQGIDPKDLLEVPSLLKEIGDIGDLDI